MKTSFNLSAYFYSTLMKEKRSGDGDNGEIAGLDDNKAGDFSRENAGKTPAKKPVSFH
ncbi:hypothetical protein [Pantoea allii]|uniref:hypothetical protein n=1 Tax=Pantoea allii TaxID=574096 RepID=UPI003D31510E